MKRLTLTTAVLAIVAAPALFAQSTLNTTAPGASQETKPGQTNNNLQNPGSNMDQGAPNQNGTFQEHGTVEGTANESATGTNDLNNQNGTSTGTTGTTGTTTGSATGTMNNTDSTGTTGTMNNDTTGTGSTGSGSMNNTDTTTGSTGSYSGSSSDTTSTSASLPQTASDLPTVAIAGLLALFAAFALRTYAKRNA